MHFLRSLLLLPLLAPADAAAQSADVLIRGGAVYDGSGRKPRTVDVAIRGDRIVFIGNARKWTATQTIDARGLIVAPGFIDPHVHALGDLTSSERDARQAAYALMQGVTTVVTGNDGGGPIEVGNMLAGFARDSIGPNAALLVGHGTVRGTVIGQSAREPTATELDSMSRLVESAMREGAFGLSSGLYYAPGSFAKTDEVVALAKVAGKFGGLYDSHTRDESSYSIGLLASIQEAIDIGRGGKLPVNISHIKALGVDVWGQAPEVIALIRKAQKKGVKVTADQYPWTASGTSVSAALLPRWAEAGGRDSLLARLADSSTRVRIMKEMTENMRRRGGAASLLMTSVSNRDFRPQALGKTLEEYAKATDQEPIAAAVGIIQNGSAGLASFNMNEKDIETFMKQPFVMTGSDGSDGHPRKYGTYPRKMRNYVLDKAVITMQRMVQASSAQIAATFRIAHRGRLKKGFFADVIVLNPETIREQATYVDANVHAVGVQWVFVNGVAAVSNGELTGALAGRGLNRATHD